MSLQTKIPDFALSREFIDGLYTPELIPDQVDLSNFISEVDETEKIQASLNAKINASVPTSQTPSGSLVPLTEAEAKEADYQIEAMLERIQLTRDKISLIKSRLDDSISAATSGGDGGELSFKMDISRKPRLRRAIKRIFGKKTDKITYRMYKQMLEAKASLEKEEAGLYTSGASSKEKDGKKDKKDGKDKEKKKDKGFLQRNADEEELDDSAQSEEMYERMFPKIGRDFVYKEDLNNMMDGFLSFLDPDGLGLIGGDSRSDAEARKRALEYKSVLDSGKDGSQIYKDLIKLNEDEE